MVSIGDHNDFYLTEDRRHKPREFFKFLTGLAGPTLAANPTARLLDIGCANGEFLYYLRSQYPNISAVGVDVTPEVLAKARELVPDADFFVADVQTGENLPGERFDVVFMNGVHYLLPDYERWLRNVISLSRGMIYVFGVFNPENLDFRAVVSRSGEAHSQISWNLVSQKSIGSCLERIGTGIAHRFHNWELPVHIPRTHDDPMRCWTITTDGGQRLQINGLQIVHRLAVLEIDVRSYVQRR
jgi:SAM-dependent methyltransferase